MMRIVQLGYVVRVTDMKTGEQYLAGSQGLPGGFLLWYQKAKAERLAKIINDFWLGSRIADVEEFEY